MFAYSLKFSLMSKSLTDDEEQTVELDDETKVRSADPNRSEGMAARYQYSPCLCFTRLFFLSPRRTTCHEYPVYSIPFK
jgi:hypothetical protein